MTRICFFFLALALGSILAIAQTPSADQLSILRNLPADQQQQLMQSVLNGSASSSNGRPSDSLTKRESGGKSLESIAPKDPRFDQYDSFIKDKTVDGRPLRLNNEEPEIRAEDTVLVDLVPIDRIRRPIVQNQTANAAAAGTSSMGLNSRTTTNLPQDATAAAAGLADERQQERVDRLKEFGRNQYDDKPLTDAETNRVDDFRQLILKSNPYKITRAGALELPGLPPIQVAGLTAKEATTRLSADPELRWFVTKVTLMRLKSFGNEALKPFGYDLFEGVPSTFAPVSDIQVPSDYVVGPGDTFRIQMYGNQPGSYDLAVNRAGQINFPRIGPINLNGLSFLNARAAIEQRVTQELVGTRVSVMMGDLRSIRVFVLGEAERPGSYTVSGLSTMTNALFVSGGVKKIGSLRNIQLKRHGNVISTLDLYRLLLAGDTSADRQLLPGDVIFIPPLGPTVAVDGAVQRPAIYELKNEKTASEAVSLAGGLLPDADGKKVQMEKILPSKDRRMENIDLTAHGGSTLVTNGSKINVLAIRPTLENSITLSGYVYRPGAFEYRPGIRLSDIIGDLTELRPNADQHYAMIRRELPPDYRVTVNSVDLAAALAHPRSEEDLELKPRDKVYVFDLSASRERIIAPVVRDLEIQSSPETPAPVVTVQGKVKAPGKYPLQSNMRVSDLIRAGGSMEDAAFGASAELSRYQVGESGRRDTLLIPVDLDAIKHGTLTADFELKPYDVLVIKPIPQWEQPGTIEVAGEVRFPGRYPIHRGETLRAVLKRAGGLTDLAFPFGAIYIREELKQRERDLLDLLVNRMQSDLAALTLESVSASVATSSGNTSNNAATSIAIGQQLITQLREAKPVGRLVIDLQQIATNGKTVDDVEVREGDKLMVPKRTQEITILGEVQSPTSHVYRAGLSRDDYISLSGGVTQKADHSRIYVVRANGDVISGERSGWFRRHRSVEIEPGDTIIVPLDTERIRALPLWQAVTTIIYNLAVALLAVRSV